ncbi:MAG: nitrophenyl compound nitroreductase subunit ArsF family protein [Dehalococcoidales bacterium]|nr:nitrophenyl compound nitroreductase subunit ArsF family protein [Dehalococcoidales bacterium]
MLERAKSVRKQLLVLAVAAISALLLASCTASPSAPSNNNGNENASHLKINILGTESEIPVDSGRKILSDSEVISADGSITLSVDKGTSILDSGQNPVQSIQVIIGLDPPAAPENTVIIGPAYDFLPEGITIDPPIRLTLSYNPAEIPQGTKEGDIYIARFDDGGWETMRYKQVDINNHRISTLINSHSGYAILAPIAPDEPAPATGPDPQANRVDLVYFHRTNRCYSCNWAEAATRYTLEAYFQEELDSGKITFESINVQEESNAAIIEKYGAYTSQLFINTVIDNTDHIEHISEIWQLIGDEEGFTLFMRTKIDNALEGVS